MPGMSELLVILVIVMLVFGAGKLPAIGDSLGRSIKNFRRSAAGDDEIEVAKTSQLADSRRSEVAGRASGEAESSTADPAAKVAPRES